MVAWWCAATDVSGVDHHRAAPAAVSAVAARLIDLQITCGASVGDLHGLGVPDGSDDVLLTQAELLLPRIAPELASDERASAEPP
jgi:hypothetical protein